jgi:hypothetical protein
MRLPRVVVDPLCQDCQISLKARYRKYVRLMFADPNVRALHVDWPEAARTAVASLRMEAAQDPEDPDLAKMVRELAVLYDDFRTWCAGHHATSAS